MTFLYIYIACLTFGLLYSVIALLFGGDHHGVDSHDSGDTGVDGVSPFKPIVIASFITFFGGFGIIGHYLFAQASLWILLASIALGFVGAAAIFYTIVVPLYKSQSNSMVSCDSLKSTTGDVITPIPSQGLGEISYVAGDVKYTSPAKSASEEEIPKGSRIVIVDIKDNVATVIKRPEIKL